MISPQPPVIANIITNIKNGLAIKTGKGQQTGTVKQKKKIRFTDAEDELRLKQELKKTPTAETNSALLTTNKVQGTIAAAGI